MTPPPMSKKVCSTSMRWRRSAGSSPTLKVIQVPIPITGTSTPVEGIARFRTRPGCALATAGSRSRAPAVAAREARKVRRLIVADGWGTGNLHAQFLISPMRYDSLPLFPSGGDGSYPLRAGRQRNRTEGLP